MFDKFKTQGALKIYGICALSVAFICVVLRTAAMLLFLDTDLGYFERGAVLPTISNALSVVATLAALAFCLVPKIKVAPKVANSTRGIGPFAIPAAICFAFFTIKSIVGTAAFAEIYQSVPYIYVFFVFDIAASMGACIFFVLKALGKAGSNISSLICGILSVIWFVIALIDCYFNQAVPMNSPLKLVFQFASLAAMLFCVNEMRVGVDGGKTGFHLFSATVAAIFLPLSAIPSAICYACDKMPSTYSLIYSDIVLLSVSVFAIARLAQMCFGKQPQPIDEGTAPDSKNGQEQTDDSQET